MWQLADTNYGNYSVTAVANGTHGGSKQDDALRSRDGYPYCHLQRRYGIVERRQHSSPETSRSGHIYSKLCDGLWHFTGFNTGGDHYSAGTDSTTDQR